jgi:hypothetical protein
VFRVLAAAEALALIGLTVALAVVVFHISVDGTGSIWDVFTAVGTVGATLAAIWLAYRGIRRERTAVAGLVSSWITDDFRPDAATQSYTRLVVAHIANESSEPVFDAHAVVFLGVENRVNLGPLSIPPLPVLAQKREQVFDLSTPLLAHDNTWTPRIELSFTDSRGRRWLRDVDGKLSDITSQNPHWVEGSGDERQLGRMGDVRNPMALALAFLAALQATPLKKDDLMATLAPEATWWGSVDWESLSVEFSSLRPTSMVDYPAPYIARVKLAAEELEGKAVAGERMSIQVKILTLTFAPSRGWRVWGIGMPVSPEEIQFPPGTW